MEELNTIIIEVNNLNKTTWAKIYLLLHDIENHQINNSSSNINDFTIYLFPNSRNIRRITLPVETILSPNNFNQISIEQKKDYLIVFNKNNSAKNFSELLPFFNLIDKYRNRISICININNILNKIDRDEYYFSISQFLNSFRSNKNIRKGEQIYLAYNYEFIDEKTGKRSKQNTARLAEHKEYSKNVSKEFSPLIRINPQIKELLFTSKSQNQEGKLSKSVIVKYLEEDIKKYNNEVETFISKIEKKKNPSSYESNKLKNYQMISSYAYKNFFSEYFIKSLVYHLADIKEIGKVVDFSSTIYLMEKYGEGIEEIIDNIIFHTRDKIGYFFFTYKKISEIFIEEYIKSLENISLNIARILEIHISDFSERGILDTFNKTNKLDDLFDINKISEEFSHLDLRYAAHLGLKIFHKNIVNCYGNYRVETSHRKLSSKLIYARSFDSKSSVNSNEEEDKIYGTHYTILLPISDKIVKNIPSDSLITYQSEPLQYTDWLYNKTNSIQYLHLNLFCVNKIDYSKDEQLRTIESIGNQIIKISGSQKSIAFNYHTLGELFSEPQIFFRLIAYLQLKAESYIDIIIVDELPGSFIEKIDELLKDFLIKTNKIWNKHTAIVLITKYLFQYILNGETKEEVTHINQQLRLHYPCKDDYFQFSKINSNMALNYTNKFIQPYELLVYEGFDNVFESYVSKILDNNIEDEKIGFKLQSENVILGSKIIVKNFYEADVLFQNSFFVDRFAFLIAKQIKELVPTKELILIGYGLYSEFLTNTVKDFINKTNKIKCKVIIIAKNIDKDDWVFRGISKENLQEKFNDYNYATIVPIGSTLSTNDKIIAKFIQFLNVTNNSHKNFTYNVSVILVRDNSLEIKQNNLTEKEEEYWEKIINKTIYTKFKNARKVSFFVSKNGLWFNPIELISFPLDFRNELPVLKTRNLSVNSVRTIGWPKVKELTDNEFNNELKRLELFREYTSIGHFDWNNSHLHYYFDTESFIAKNQDEVSQWLKKIKNDDYIGLNVILTPNNNIESSFVKLINEIIFNKNAFVIYIDIYNDVRDNLKHKYSFLKKIEEDSKQIRFHFVDHVLSTGESTRKARSYISSILEKNKNFSSIITIINRLSFEKNKEIGGYAPGKNIIHEFFNLFIPPIKSLERDCSICQSIRRYKKINELTTIDSLSNWLDNKIENLKIKNFNSSNKSFIDGSKKFDRIILTHSIFYNISFLLFQNKSHEEILNYLNELGKNEDISFKINFVKVLSTQPLSNYQHIKNFIFGYMLNELFEILKYKDVNSYHIVKFNYLIVLLKHLSELGSNALVRKELIQKVWIYYFNFINVLHIRDEIGRINEEIRSNKTKIKEINSDLFNDENLEQRLNKLNEELSIAIKAERNVENFNTIFLLYVNNIISYNETSAVWLGNLLRSGEEKLNPKEISISDTIPYNSFFTFFDKKEIDNLLTPKYKNFLAWLHYDNTIITRNTIKRFEDEMDRNKYLQEKFYSASESGILKSFSNFLLDDNLEEVKSIFKQVIEREYYHKYIRLYLEVTSPPVLHKLILSIYAKLLFKQILDSEDASIQLKQKIQSILEIYTSIMDANSSFLTLGKSTTENYLENTKKNKYRVLALFNIKKEKHNDNLKSINKYFYTHHILEKDDNIYPITSNDTLKRDKEGNIHYREKSMFSINAINIYKFVINGKLKGSITFLYKEPFKDFDTYSKELSRYFLTLKNEFNKFLNIAYNKHSINDLITSLDNEDKFDRIYTNSDHHFSSYTRNSFASIYKIIDTDKASMLDFLNPIITLSDSTISWLYSKVEKNSGDLESCGISILRDTSIKEVFTNNYLGILKLLNKFESWEGNLEINGFHLINDCDIKWYPEILQSFIILLLKNAMHTHKSSEDKIVRLTYRDKTKIIEVNNNFPDSEDWLQEEKESFSIKKKAIDTLNVEDYSCTTLTSLKSYCNFLGLSLNYGYDNHNNFYVAFNLK